MSKQTTKASWCVKCCPDDMNCSANYMAKCLVIGRDAKDVPVEDALDYVAAYTAGNDISSRKLQRDPALAGKVPQWGFSKGFDTFAPLGPCLVASRLIGNPAGLHLTTKIDGELRQDESVSDLLFDCAYLVSYLSQGTTLQKGSVIMTGTPGGRHSRLVTRICCRYLLTISHCRCGRRTEPSTLPHTWHDDGSFDL